MIHCVLIEQLSARLATIPALIDRYQRGEMDFPDATIRWLEETEKLIGRLRLPEASELATLRARVLKAADLAHSEEKRSAIRRSRNVAASDAIERAEAILHARVQTAEERLGRFEEKLCEGMTAFLLQNALPPSDGDHHRWLTMVWERFATFQPTRPLVIYVNASLSKVDRTYLFDRVLAQATAEGLQPSARGVESGAGGVSSDPAQPRNAYAENHR